MRKWSVLAGLLVFSLIVAVAWQLDRVDLTGERVASAPSSLEFAVSVNPLDEPVSLVSPAVVEWMNREYTARQLYETYRSKNPTRLDYSLPVVIRFEVMGVPAGASIESQVVEVSPEETFSSPQRVSVESPKTQVSIYNLKTNQTYFYRVTITATNGETAQTVGSFSTADTPRFLWVDGIRNVRDLGGVKTVDGHRVKQGLLYRGTEWRGTLNKDFSVTPEGERVLLEDLKIRTEMDLRDATEGGQPVGDIQQQYYRLFASYSEVFLKKNHKAVRQIFSDLAKEEYYPAYVHCTWGSDRTGTVCYLLHALLGVSPEDCYGGWELTTFFNGGSYDQEMEQFMKDMQALPGATLQDKTEGFLLSVGVTKEEIESIRRIFLED